MFQASSACVASAGSYQKRVAWPLHRECSQARNVQQEPPRGEGAVPLSPSSGGGRQRRLRGGIYTPAARP
ncbi:hypothetical protein [Comamonas composti]|uniref:hypothetical protein n=1 Tax=Comamonas composti TaxID=408558 RepID=UPI00387E1972